MERWDRMARFLVYTGPGSGHLYPLVPTMAELRRRGHRVAVRAEPAGLRHCTALGIGSEPFDPRIAACADDAWQATDPMDALRRTIGVSLDRARYEIEDLRRAVERERPDALLVNNNCWGAGAAAEASGLPWAQAALFLLPLVSTRAPTFGVGLPGPGTAAQRARAEREWEAMGRAINALLPPVNQMRAGAGAPGLAAVWDTYLRAPAVLSYTGQPLERPPAELPPSVRLVGPGGWDPAGAQPPPQWLARLRRPLVLVTASTVFQNDTRLIQTTLDALAGEPFDVVATTASLDPELFRRPANARVVRFLPHSQVLPRSAVVVCHGGMGITQKTLLAGVPLCLLPGGRDQFEVARRVTGCGAGTQVLPPELTADRLRGAVHEAVTLREAAQRAGAMLRAAGGPAAAATALEGLLPATAAA
jgi:MGT family glycosyltransferase